LHGVHAILGEVSGVRDVREEVPGDEGILYLSDVQWSGEKGW